MRRLLPLTGPLTLVACGPDPLIGSWDCSLLEVDGQSQSCPEFDESDERLATYAWGADFTADNRATLFRLQTYDYGGGLIYADHYSYSGTVQVQRRGVWNLEVEDLDLTLTCTHQNRLVLCEGALGGVPWRMAGTEATIDRNL